MKDIYRNPTFYYILVPVLIGLWPLLVWAKYLPDAQTSLTSELEDYTKTSVLMLDILALDRGRLDYESKDKGVEFDYVEVVNEVAESCQIKSSNYRLSSGALTGKRGRKSQTAQVVLTGVGVEDFAKFISTIQVRWASLQCEQIKLTKKDGLPDLWDVKLDFKYFYD